MQDVDGVTECHRVDRSVCITLVILSNLQNARSSEPFERLRVRMFAAFLGDVKGVAHCPLDVVGEPSQVFERGTDPNEVFVRRTRHARVSQNWDICVKVVRMRQTVGRRLRVTMGSYSIYAMASGTVELEPEVEEWLLSLSLVDFGHVAFYIALRAERGPLLDEPYTRQLGGKLRELHFYLGRDQRRISYYLATGQRAVLLTVFGKQRPRERAEVERARRTMERCVWEGHSAEE